MATSNNYSGGANNLSLPQQGVPFVDIKSGMVSREWWPFLNNLFNRIGGNNALSNDQLQNLSMASKPVLMTEEIADEPFLVSIQQSVTNVTTQITQSAAFSFICDDGYEDAASVCISFRKP